MIDTIFVAFSVAKMYIIGLMLPQNCYVIINVVCPVFCFFKYILKIFVLVYMYVPYEQVKQK